MKKHLITCLLTSSLLLCSCATSMKGKVIQNAMIGAAVGVLIGQSKESHKGPNSILYGSLGASLGALGTIQYSDPDKEIDSLKAANTALEKALEKTKPKLMDQGSTMFSSSKIPSDLKGLITPGSWKRYSIDQWHKDESNPNVYYKQTEMVEIIPPSQNE
jgi:hypothetical protein